MSFCLVNPHIAEICKAKTQISVVEMRLQIAGT